jgi:hypothetical protein
MNRCVPCNAWTKKKRCKHCGANLVPKAARPTLGFVDLHRLDMPLAETVERTKAECRCSLRIKLVGDGCAICNPELWKDLLRHEDKGHIPCRSGTART